ncbi:hypothetical protein CAPTEDRAFT_165206, partial [Capitella teleta]
MAATAGSKTEERRSRVMVGELPADFLRVGGAPQQQQQIAADHHTAAMLQAQQQLPGQPFSFTPQNISRLRITVVQAKLSKNYGLTKMDPYCRLRVGHSVFETPTAHSGGKNPRWNKTIQCQTPTGIDSIYLEIFDERAFTMDDRIAWAHIAIPSKIFSDETSDDWYTLSGRQGDEKEGMVNLVLSHSKVKVTSPAAPIVYQSQQPVVMMGAGVTGVPVIYPQQSVAPVTVMQPGMPPMQQPQIQQPQMQPQQQPPQPPFTDEDVMQVKEMFPNMDKEAIQSVMEANGGNKDATINCLLSMES